MRRKLTPQDHLRQSRIAGFVARHLDYLACAGKLTATPAASPDLLFYRCPVCGFGYFETFELSHHAIDPNGRHAEWEPLCPACPPHPAGPPRMRNLPVRAR